jgi:hypothetical protein
VERPRDHATDLRPEQVSISHALRELAGSADPAPAAGVPGGPEYRVLTRTVDGMHLVTGISPVPPGEAEKAEIRALIRSLLDLADLESGPACTRVVLTAAGPRIIDCALGVG